MNTEQTWVVCGATLLSILTVTMGVSDYMTSKNNLEAYSQYLQQVSAINAKAPGSIREVMNILQFSDINNPINR